MPRKTKTPINGRKTRYPSDKATQCPRCRSWYLGAACSVCTAAEAARLDPPPTDLPALKIVTLVNGSRQYTFALLADGEVLVTYHAPKVINRCITPRKEADALYARCLRQGYARF